MQLFTARGRTGSRGKKNRKAKNGSFREVAYTVRGHDTIASEGSGGFDGGKRVPTVWVVTKSGERWEVPVDPKTGKVPEEYLHARFLSGQGSRDGRPRSPKADRGVDAEIVHKIPKGGFTPKGIIETGWWQRPNESDIEGIDDIDSAILARELSEASRSARGAGRSIVFLMPEKEADRARSILARDFNARELNSAVHNGGIIIKEGNPGRSSTGRYISVQQTSSLKAPVIVLRPGWDEETLVHEFTHHLRHADDSREGLTRTPYKMDKNGERLPSYMYSGKSFESARNLEEAATVSETYVRARNIDKTVGYYADTTAHGDDPFKRSTYDRDLYARSGTARGRRAENAVKKSFEDSSIAHLNAFGGQNALNYYRARRADGTLPAAVRTSKRYVPALPPASVPGRAAAETEKGSPKRKKVKKTGRE